MLLQCAPPYCSCWSQCHREDYVGDLLSLRGLLFCLSQQICAHLLRDSSRCHLVTCAGTWLGTWELPHMQFQHTLQEPLYCGCPALSVKHNMALHRDCSARTPRMQQIALNTLSLGPKYSSLAKWQETMRGCIIVFHLNLSLHHLNSRKWTCSSMDFKCSYGVTRIWDSATA